MYSGKIAQSAGRVLASSVVGANSLHALENAVSPSPDFYLDAAINTGSRYANFGIKCPDLPSSATTGILVLCYICQRKNHRYPNSRNLAQIPFALNIAS
ncbi:hypothetical protein AAKU67_002804 [Oxalobacteraceae bacterium GrIS 2.11]